MIKAVIFDLDGTLLDTEMLSDESIFDVFFQHKKFSLPQLPSELKKTKRLPWEIKSKILGMRGDTWIPMVIRYAQTNWGADKSLLEIEGDRDELV